ncbi:glycoside hydrolase family 2 TIM barrel-domain containing protein [Leeuwenhoekiella marinoflava]|uniref:beta-galactosidase n=2 Tax=Leeuwenhoekiella marinoflava TaxID=988 RepID=A0A4Q0PES2_9FLAO|nr:glycoside hydrolase family 2 TIM barrel-domain containing protein [Leeuwenhoekiella marinoflava]RXG25420.1 beta-galactosidase/beta-glucuronidase [Leeuwenhoekiella marinoflava]SHF88609.1 Beta-galactosidase/beta-glucuronidase [Leeuwenhoekiella marinoflava DSM 3653]
MKKLLLLSTLAVLFSTKIFAQKADKIWLSGTDFEHPKTWDFKVSAGNNSGAWSTIEVPSQWELQGFGEYTYGRWYKELEQDEPSKEEGLYKLNFEVPADAKGKVVTIHFGGVMTDTEVNVNGEVVGPKHHGGFYEFEYDITDYLKVGSENLLEVHVWKHSENGSVNNAERKADWWLFGGIYRPVWLEIKPKTHIDHIAVDAKMDGSLKAQLDIENLSNNLEVVASITPLIGEADFESQTIQLDSKNKEQIIEAKWKGVKTWDPENPNLYTLTLQLQENGKTIHEISERIGFRTLDFRKRDGIYLNGTKIVMKGINRHSFWPEGGRSTSKRISVMDVNLIKDMNMNAVRFHYPPDDHFLAVCDSLGLFVLDELAGWQNPYDTETGEQLIKEMIDRDVNHPSVIIWDQGNEGGWNYELDDDFAKHDPQNRIVIHPWSDFNGWDTHHYPTYLTGVHRFGSGENVFFPTEFMHGTYDNGIGAGLKDFWEHYSESPLFAGGFMWVYSDEAVLRTDWTGDEKFDSKGNLASDGVLGPHREKEGSFYTVKEVWAPVQFKPKAITETFDGSFLVTNDYLFTNLNTVTMKYRVMEAGKNAMYNPETKATILTSGSIDLPDAVPGETRVLNMPVADDFFKGDWLEITATDQHDREIYTWTWPIHKADYFANKLIYQAEVNKAAKVAQDDDVVTLKSKEVRLQLNTKTGYITQINSKKRSIPFVNGPKPIGMKAEVEKVTLTQEGQNAICRIDYNGGIDHITWTMYPDGRVHMELIALKNAGRNSGFDGAFYEGDIDKFGITFDFPEEGVEAITLFGRGPYHTWRNRLQGIEYGIWEKEYNTTITGASFDNLVYPEFKGYYANFLAGNLQAGENSFKVFSESDKLFLRLFTPDEVQNGFRGSHFQPSFPDGNISFMYEIPGQRAFKPLSQQGPSSQPSNIRIKSGDDGISMKLWFDFREDRGE